MTATVPATLRRGRTWRWVALGIVLIVLLAAITTWLTAPRDGGLLDPDATGPDGAHALVALLRDQGVDVEVASTASEAARLSGPNTLLLVGQTYNLWEEDLLTTLADASGDLLLINPSARTREALAPKLEYAPQTSLTGEPDCDLREAQQAGTVWFSSTYAFEGDDGVEVTSCYGGALVRYRDGGRTVTAVGTTDFVTNSTLLREGNAALAMNLAGSHPRLIWYAPQEMEGDHTGSAHITDLIPDRFNWIVLQLCLAVLLVALWQGRRLGPLVSERLPVVVRASETVEGRGRLYRSHRARDQAAAALRTATLQRLLPRLGLAANADPSAVVAAVTQNLAQRGGDSDPLSVQHTLFGPAPATDDDLVHLAHALDDIERQVAHS
ncbi:DUF4350 domain-containing protein [Mycolicibacterium confluentis]|uniref:Membrane protein n=1 Tax=Mycolicibacterium confluentis TaxID=28047 RepID=A0A7I7Y5B2_9MYCO|nr:DUF4350 domain-containing protein [Mycolicibacterium confluentis]MCV7319251.1 DUF4350 domain-containing protein [Mycolicibacterium confluentis]ORV33557.1 hypothetical protein AWB99_08130 [Mycolicibacterium confluentis]BBZ36866.1 membrane protein [Mycolicibacterium confluentis]